uniref:Glycosyltransferase family 92 protein n=1 Tax=Panagrolaimus sp. PS1159 TaxID=55785 RepID=A0AC35GMJ8_9BILA
MIGYIGLIKSNKLGNDEYIYFSTTNKRDSFNVEVKIEDVRISLNHFYPHNLGVCVQPIYLHADHFLFIQFFEYWLSQGATKFYIYRESYTKDVQKVLDYYLTASEASIELIDWSQLPSPNDQENVNKYIYRLEMMLSIFDCVTRSRSHVKYLAQTDLDEFIYIKNGTRVLDFMKDFDKKHPDFSSASFSSQRIAFQKDLFDHFTSPYDISFSFLENVSIEKYIFQRPYYSKLIYRPERVLRVHPHKQMQPDRPYFTNQKAYINALVDNNEGLVMHMRRINDTFKWKTTENSTMFATLAKT